MRQQASLRKASWRSALRSRRMRRRFRPWSHAKLRSTTQRQVPRPVPWRVPGTPPSRPLPGRADPADGPRPRPVPRCSFVVRALCRQGPGMIGGTPPGGASPLEVSPPGGVSRWRFLAAKTAGHGRGEQARHLGPPGTVVELAGADVPLLIPEQEISVPLPIQDGPTKAVSQPIRIHKTIPTSQRSKYS